MRNLMNVVISVFLALVVLSVLSSVVVTTYPPIRDRLFVTDEHQCILNIVTFKEIDEDGNHYIYSTRYPITSGFYGGSVNYHPTKHRVDQDRYHSTSVGDLVYVNEHNELYNH